MTKLNGILLFYWKCPVCGSENSDTSDKLNIKCDDCGLLTNFSSPHVRVTSQWELHNNEDERFKIWSDK